MGSGARWGLTLGVVLIAALTTWLAYRALRVDYDVLFTQLADGDAAAIIEQLKAQKVPYRLTDRGATIQVPALQVHETRLRLMSSGVPLSGGIGFEIFDKQGLGATEQSQRVSYQRALQGELARTIATLDGVRSARVHLVLPESTLFKRDRQEARGAVTLTMKNGAMLDREQIVGVQRLVAASVAGLEPSRVVIADQRGITLSGPDSLGGASASEGRLTMKRDIEEYLTRKVARMLDSAYGPGQAIVSVDVSLNFDEIRRTVQEMQPSGVRRRRQVNTGADFNDENAAAALSADGAATAPSNTSTDVEYEYGRRVEQVIGAPGSVTRISVGVIVPGDLSADKQQRIRDLVRVAAGVNEQRGDAIVVETLGLLSTTAPVAALEAEIEAAPATPPTAGAEQSQPNIASPLAPSLWNWVLAIVAAAALFLLLAAHRRMRMRADADEPPPLSMQERERLLLEIERSLQDGASAAGTRARP